MDKIAVVVTTIGDGSFLEAYVRAINKEALAEKISLVIIPDLKTPRRLFEKCEELRKKGQDIICPTVKEQDDFLERLGPIRRIIPYNSDNRRNVGYLIALAHGCDILISADDDNLPREGEPYFSAHALVNQKVCMDVVHSSSGWFNICELLQVTPSMSYPRGFPYRYRHTNPMVTRGVENGVVHINAGLWLGHPDVDAVTCLHGPVHAERHRGGSVLLGPGTWSPINSQNTAVARSAVIAYYFVPMGYRVMGMPIDRYGDIFSGYFVQVCARHLGYRVRVGTPIVDHTRNSHHYLRDLTHELAGIWILEDLTEWLHQVKLEGSTYSESYLCLASMIEDAVEEFSGFVWNDAARGYFHYVSYCIRTWISAVESVGGA